MAHVDWSIKGPEIATCNCNWGCPCQFNALPSNGNCRATLAIRIDEGHFGDVRLDGLKIASVLAWPGAVHQGHGEAQFIIDERATPAQRDALLKIMRGEETEPFATFFAVYSAMVEKFHEPLSSPIEFEIDVEERTSRFSVPGIVTTTTEPIRNPVTGNPHRAKVVLPHGFEYSEAEFASGNWQTTGVIANDLTKRHAHLATIHVGPHGVIR
jgi:hypothetical protein